ncbi:putative beta-lysine N-acetyltransferase [Rossellomorea oryzaecorticis]|uniref:Beta-lysine N-acetyltransferase n=1 Tax=Rossellomorea oryzaecorticis TaxID=1396505 RepID=A0ABW8VNW8_9BACI
MQMYEEIEQSKLSAALYLDEMNKRIRVDLARGDLTSLLTYVENKAATFPCEKIIFKAREHQFRTLLEKGFVYEGMISHYFNGDRAHFLSRFLRKERRSSNHWSEEDAILSSVQNLGVKPFVKNDDHPILLAGSGDAAELATLYKEVFQVYPVPLQDPAYIKDAMGKGTIFVCIRENNQIISAASAEIDDQHHNAEVTDCATLPQYRKGGYMKSLIMKLEEELLLRGIFCVYTIARALSFGMNAAFHQLGYQYGGRLANNCYIYDKLEDMNIWEKDLGR